MRWSYLLSWYRLTAPGLLNAILHTLFNVSIPLSIQSLYTEITDLPLDEIILYNSLMSHQIQTVIKQKLVARPPDGSTLKRKEVLARLYIVACRLYMSSFAYFFTNSTKNRLLYTNVTLKQRQTSSNIRLYSTRNFRIWHVAWKLRGFLVVSISTDLNRNRIDNEITHRRKVKVTTNNEFLYFINQLILNVTSRRSSTTAETVTCRTAER